MATGVEATTSSHIEEMIKELTQQEGLEVPVTGMILEGITTMTTEPSSQSSLPKDLLVRILKENKDSPFTLILMLLLTSML